MEQLKRFRIPFETINDCTKNFDKENLIGKGGYGNVYKGILSWTDHKNQPVAVKRLDKTGLQGNKEFCTEITMLSQYRHKNIIAFVGFCDEGEEMIVVYEYASHGSLDKYLTDGKMLDQLSWKRRLKICIGIASALEYLHNHAAAQHRVIHRDMKSANILLDENWKPKLSDFGLSKIGLSNQQNTFLITDVAGTHGYCDPQYVRTGILTKESDVYSFGVVLFEVLCGRLVCVIEYHDQRRFLHHLVRTYYKNGEVEKIVDYRIRDHIKGIKMIEFSAIAYQCLQETREERPTIHEVVLQLKKLKDTQDLVSSSEKKAGDREKKYEISNKLSDERLKQALDEETETIQLETALHRFGLQNHSLQEKISDMECENQILRHKTLSTRPVKSISNGHFGNELMEQLQRFRIPFETINDCTKNFDKENLIGKGRFGNVYKGILSWTDHKNQPVAVKRLDETGFQGKKEFYTEITMLSQYRHKNIIALVGFCDEGKEMIVVSQYASHGSLDKYLTDGKMLDQLSWKRRLKICIGIASALEYLHNHVAAQHRVIHRDMKSANILLDENWKPKLSGFGLSRIGLANQQHTFLITNVAGTPGYCDPQYQRTGILTKESDVYSLGVVLFEVLCGRLECVIEYHDQRRFLHYLVRTYYEKGKLDKIVDYRIRDHIKGTKMSKFSAIAYQCLQETREERPTIHKLVLHLKKLKDTQVIIGGGGGGASFGGGSATASAPAGGAAAAEAPAAEEKKEETEESDDDMGFSLFD